MTTLKIYVINLDERNDRWNKIKEIFNHPMIKLERVSAIRENPGWLGLYKTNRIILEKQLKEEKEENFIVIEDDCALYDNINDFYDRFCCIKNYLDSNTGIWDIFNGGMIFQKHQHRKYIEFGKILNNNICSPTIFFNYNSSWTCTQFIYYNIKSVRKILENTNPDKWDDYLNNFKCLTCYPFLTYQYASFSDIEERDVNYTERISDRNNKIKIYLTELNINLV